MKRMIVYQTLKQTGLQSIKINSKKEGTVKREYAEIQDEEIRRRILQEQQEKIKSKKR